MSTSARSVRDLTCRAQEVLATVVATCMLLAASMRDRRGIPWTDPDRLHLGDIQENADLVGAGHDIQGDRAVEDIIP